MQTVGLYEECMTTREASAYLGLANNTLQQRYRDMKIEPLRIGGWLYFQKAELDAYLARNERAAARRAAMEQRVV